MPQIRVNDQLFQLSTGDALNPPQAFSSAFLKYRDMIFESYDCYPHLQNCHFQQRFSEEIGPEAMGFATLKPRGPE